MLFKHNGKINLTAKGAETSKGNKNSFLGKLFGSSSKDENGEAAGTANVTTVFEYEVSAEMSVEEIQQLYKNNREDMDQIESDMKKFMSAVRICYDESKSIVLDVIEESHKNDLRECERNVEYNEVREQSDAKKKETYKKFHSESKSE